MRPTDVGRAPFPAGVSVVALVVGFLFTRVFVGLAMQRPGIAASGTFAAVSGVLLALGACGVLVWQSGDDLPSLQAAVARAVRLLALVPVTVLAVSSMAGVLPRTVQWWGLAGGCVTLAIACGRGILVSRGQWLARATLALFFLGETIELLGPPVRVGAPPGTFWPALAERVAPAGEVAAFVGVALALAWAIQRTVASAGLQRVSTFAAMPAALALVLATLPVRFPRTTETVARYAFGVRFDLATHAGAGHPSRGSLVAYTLLASGLLAASSVSVAAQFTDRGAATRRALGWACVLMGGFGAVTMAGPVDPLRLVVLLLGALLLEQSAVRDALPVE